MKRFSMPMRNISRSAAFSLVEMMVVVGILGILVSVGSVTYIRQMNESRVESAAQMVESRIKQARQMAIAMRQSRRVVITTNDPMTIWIEGKRTEGDKVEPKYFEDMASQFVGANQSNKFEITDRDSINRNVTITDVDGVKPNGMIFIEFNPRGQATKVYFSGEEQDSKAFNKAPILHFMRVGEVIDINDAKRNFEDSFNDLDLLTWDHKNATERFKAYTVEVVRLTGRTRKYEYGMFYPWPSDEQEKK